MQQSELIGVLEKIEAEDFLRPTFLASGYGTVADVIGATEEVRTLLANKDGVLPELRTRYRERKASMPDTAHLVYFVVFGLARDRQMTSEIISYLKQCMVLPIEQLKSPWLAFLHGARALELITNGSVRTPGTGGSRKQFEEFLSDVQAWADTQ